MSVFLFISFLFLGFQLLFAYRIFIRYAENNLFSVKQLTKIGTIYFLICFLFVLFVSIALQLKIFIIFSLNIAFVIALFTFKKHRETRFRKGFELFLKRLLLLLKMGHSLRDGFKLCQQHINPQEQKIYEKISETVFFSQQNTIFNDFLFFNQVIFEFHQCILSPHQCLERLETYLYQLKIESNFRHRSGQARKQSQIQMFIVSFLFCGLLFYVVQRYSFEKHQDLIVISVSLFVFGGFLTNILTKKRLWKV